MARLLTESFTVPADSTGESPVYSSWAEVGDAEKIHAGVTVTNNYSPDVWLQFADDIENPLPEDGDAFLVDTDPDSNGQHYYVHAHEITPAGAYVRVKIVAWDQEAPCRVRIDTE